MKKAGIRGYGTCAWSYNASFDCKRPVTRSTSIERETNLSSREFLRGGGGGLQMEALRRCFGKQTSKDDSASTTSFVCGTKEINR